MEGIIVYETNHQFVKLCRLTTMNSETEAKNTRMDLIDDLIDVKGNLTFIEAVNSKYDWSSETSKEINNRLRDIRMKQEDKNLNLSVIGEFSTGKSTFINALLRSELLESDILQGTTAAATVIRYGKKKNIFIKKTVGGTEKLYEIKSESIIDDITFIKKVTEATTKKSEESKKETVILEYPSETLKNNIVIVDTPGTNVTEVWHEEITSNAIHSLSDASIVVIDAIKLVPISLVTFINNNLQDVIKNCVFIVNRMDLLRPGERERQLDYIRKFISKTFDVEAPIVCPYTSLFVLGESVPHVLKDVNYNKEDSKDLVQQSYQTEATIYSYLAERRMIIQRTKLLELIDHTFDVLQSNMKKQIAFDQNKHLEIEASKIKDVDSFMLEKINRAADDIMSAYVTEKRQFEFSMKEQLGKKKEGIKANLNSIEDRKYLSAYVNNLPNNMQKAAMEAVNYYLTPILDYINRMEQAKWEQFFDDFKKQYHRLAIHGKQEDFISDAIAPDFEMKLNTNISTALSEASNKYQKIGDAANLSGAAGGAVLGQLIIPIPIVGAAIGLMAGWMFGDKIGMPIKKMRADYWTKMEPVIDQYFNNIAPEFLSYISQYQSAIIERLRQKILQCKGKYNLLIQTIDRQDNERQKELQTHLSEMNQDLMRLERRKDTLQSTRGITSKL